MFRHPHRTPHARADVHPHRRASYQHSGYDIRWAETLLWLKKIILRRRTDVAESRGLIQDETRANLDPQLIRL
ncbi:hypothetical protein COCCADRAFT_84815 [Bipolaris zeicola 26-R-13]|uniref:Uncharacterized protein n=1 Tax=Cochliobolus carbonum (strain 26-R-13) TaxID=930089 RepID=W6YJG0_COCC2|nr:uncharacterized protein COCCADRAFT_84815 [Bipolaris zeicola 26-R-13]EUC37700.1 hypothetical protein COCCADRAFT_84815 [Bipolaris zeicola 26-R-13]